MVYLVLGGRCWSLHRPRRRTRNTLQSDDLLATVFASIDRGECKRRPVESVFDVLAIDDGPGLRPRGELLDDRWEPRHVIKDDKSLVAQSFGEKLSLAPWRHRRRV